jgi:hypothetical protein
MAWLGHTNEKLFRTVETTVDIPLDDKTAWKMYPNNNWVYSTSRLLEMQNISWSPFYQNGFDHMLNEFCLDDTNKLEESPMAVSTLPGKIFVRPMHGDVLTTVVAVLKGEIKWAAHHVLDASINKNVVLQDLRGDVELRISALTTLHFRKFAGVITVDSIGHDIIATKLRMTPDVVSQYPEDWLKRVVRIYSRRPWGK